MVLVLGAACAAYPAMQPTPVRRIVVLLAIVAGTGLVGAVAFRWARAVAWSLGGFVIEYGVALAGRDQLDAGAPLYGAALFLLAEVAFALLAYRTNPFGTPAGLPLRWAARLAGGTGVALASGALVLVVVAVPLPHGTPVQAGGLAAAAALLAVVVLLVRRRA